MSNTANPRHNNWPLSEGSREMCARHRGGTHYLARFREEGEERRFETLTVVFVWLIHR